MEIGTGLAGLSQADSHAPIVICSRQSRLRVIQLAR
jgi:hypothetical protein